MNARLLVVASILLALAVVGTSYYQAGRDGLPSYWSTLESIEGLLDLHTAIDREALLLVSGQKISFDSITGFTASLKQASEVSMDPRLAQLTDEKSAAVERFKQRLAVYRNSGRNVIQLIYEMHDADVLPQLSRREIAILGNLSRAVLSRLSIRDDQSKRKLEETLREVGDFEFGPPANSDWHSLLRHTRVLSESSEDVQTLLGRITDPGIGHRARTLLGHATVVQQATANRAASWRLTLLASSIVLVALLVYLARLVVRHQGALRHLNDRLEEKVQDRTKVLEATSADLQKALDENYEQQKSLVRLSEALFGAQEGIMILGADQRVVFANRAYSSMFGYDLDQIVGNTHPAATHLDRLAALASNPTERGEHVVFDQEVPVAADQTITCEVSIGTIASQTQEAAEYVVIAKDVSERRKLEGQLAQAQKLESIGQLAAGIAHEINTPAQYTANNVQFMTTAWEDLGVAFDALRSGSQGTPRSQDQIRAMWDEIDMDYLIEEVPLALQQATAGLDQIASIVVAMKNFAHPGVERLEETDVNAAIRDTITIAKSEWKYVAEMQTDFDESLPPVPAVRSSLNQVWLNIIVNAAHAIEDKVGESDTKGQIEIVTRKSPDGALIIIRDTGSGIPKEIQTRVFDPFFTTKSVGKGSGQGLAIARSVIAEQHNGEISVSSEPGEGTEFSILLPFENPLGENGDARLVAI